MAITKIKSSGIYNITKSDSMLIGNPQNYNSFIAVGNDSGADDFIPDIFAFTGSGVVTQNYANPTPFPSGANTGIKFSPSKTEIAISHSGTPFVTVYPFQKFSGFGTKYANPVTLPAATGRSVVFSPSGAHIAIAHDTTPFVSVYPWSSGFGSKYANPVTLPTGSGRRVTFSPSGDVLAVAHFTTPFISFYPWSSGTGFGTKYANPGTLPRTAGYEVAFSPSGAHIAVANGGGSFLRASWSSVSGFSGSTLTNMSGNSAFGIDFI